MATALVQIHPTAVSKILDAHDREGNVYHFTVAGDTLSLDVEGESGGMQINLRQDGTWSAFYAIGV